MASRDNRQAEGAPARGCGQPADPGGTLTRAPALRRRELFGTAVGITAASLAAMVPAARAQTGTPGTVPGTTPGSAPAAAGGGGEKPTVEGTDLVLVRFLRSVELALEELYADAMDSGRLKPAALDLAAVFTGHHRDHADRLVDLAGSEAPTAPNGALLAALSPRVSGARDERELATTLGDIEDQAAATYLWGHGTAQDWQLAALLATVAPVDGQHATAWSRVVDPDPQVWLTKLDANVPVTQTTNERWDPAQYPVGPA